MYCPKCAAQNAEDAKFCRTCGANLSLVPQALTGKFGKQQRRELERRPESSIAHGISTAFMGIGFLVVAFAISLSRSVGGQVWWYWMLIPAFSMLGKGASQIYTALQAQKQLQHEQYLQSQQLMQPSQQGAAQQQARNTGEIHPAPTDDEYLPPVSVTETTTRHLDAVRPRNREIS